MKVELIIATIPGKSRAQREQMRQNAAHKLATGTKDQKDAARLLIEALDAQIEADSAHLEGLPLADKVAQAFRTQPPSDAEEKVLRALLDHPGSTSGRLSEACGWRGLSWHLHFAEICKRREHLLWAAPRYEKKDANFWCGMLADFDPDGARWTMKPEVVVGLGAIGISAMEPK